MNPNNTLDTLEEIHEKLVMARHASDFFGITTTADEIKKKYFEYSKIVHPDVVEGDKYMASETFQLLHMMYLIAIDEIKAGTYTEDSPLLTYDGMEPLFTLDINGKKHDFYENYFRGETGTIYKGISENELVFLKQANTLDEDELIVNEYNTLSKLRHVSLPIVEKLIKLNGSPAIIMREVTGVMLKEFLDKYPKGIPPTHAMWAIERMLSVVGYLHKNYIVHGNIKPENVIIDTATHKVSLVGFSLCITKANSKDARYKIINPYYTAPEVSATAVVRPAADIYSIGMIALKLLGGNVAKKELPKNLDKLIAYFISKMIDVNPDTRTDDAWKLWTELIDIRTKLYGTKRFIKFE